MAKTTFNAGQLEAALERLLTADKDFPEYPLVLGLDSYSLWDQDTYPVKLRQVGSDSNVSVMCKEYFGGEEGGDHAMYIILQVGYGADARYFEKTGIYDSWDGSEWDGNFTEVVPQEVKKTEWVSKK